MSIQNDYQAAIDAATGLQNSDDNAILTLNKDDLNQIEEIRAGKTTGSNDVPASNPQPDDTLDTGVVDTNTVETPVGYSKEQVEAIIRTRVANLNKKIERLQAAESAVDRIAEVSGLSREQLVARLNTMSDDEQAKILGISPQQVAAARIQRQSTMQAQQQITKLNRDLELAQLKTDKRYSDIDLFLDDIMSKIDEHPSISLKDAYTLVKGDLGLTAQIRDAEQRIANSQAAAKSKALVDPVGAAQQQPKKMSKETLNNASAVGMDPNAYEAMKDIDNIDAYRAWKKAQKGGS